MRRPAREVTVDWSRARGDRVPIVLEGRGSFDFGERAVARREDATVRGVLGWDPSLGWVLILDREADERPA
jgi:hypothetical protein